jgi:CheY-like chemotaxis protein
MGLFRRLGVIGVMGSFATYPPRQEKPWSPAGPLLAAPRVLVVEDEATVAMLIEDMVCELDYEVAAVVSRVEDAMRMLDGDSFDLAILDVHLNGKTIFPFADELDRREIPYLFATAYGARAIPAEFSSHRVLRKPFGPVELRSALMSVASTPDI